ncbi:MAG: penicillin-binding protein 2 [Actinobacteria bacterium]|nr:penicillin-binding protein 2 [Actinomycetota bacterium]
MVKDVQNNLNRKRIYFLFFLFIAAFILIVYKLISIQYVYASRYKSFAEYQHTDHLVVNAKRGKILDRNGIELSTSLMEKTVYANPKFVISPEREAEALSEILDLNVDSIREKLENKDLGFVYIKRQISSETAALISQLNLPGIYIQNENKRYYPQNDLASSIIGFTGIDNNGLNGMELQYEKILRGVDGKYIIEKDVYGNIIPGSKNNYIAPVDGGDITLTIDSQIQYILQKKLEEVTENYNALSAVGVVMNPENGEIYAMSGYPSFDLNHYQDYDMSLYKNQGISFTYEPGSTFKIVNIASSIDNGCIGIGQTFNLSPSIRVGDKIIKEAFRTYSVNYTTGEIIKYSSNIGAVTAALAMGKEIFYESIKEFGFGNVTPGIDLPGEEAGIFYNYKNWSASTIGTLAIGQGISVTPLQLLRATCAVANGGYLVTPFLTKEIILTNEKIDLPAAQEKIRIISSETAEAVKEMMLACVEDGTGKRAQVEGVKVCGKTGTAQKVNKNGLGYSEGRIITSFLGFAPYEDPNVAVIIVVDEPHGPEDEVFGGTVAAPIFSDILSFSLTRLRIEQQKEETS